MKKRKLYPFGRPGTVGRQTGSRSLRSAHQVGIRPVFKNPFQGLPPGPEKIRLVQDNLSTHNCSSFYEHLSAQEAFGLSGRLEFYYTPLSASWLNMMEIEFSALVKQCLGRRIPTQEQLRQEIQAIVKERNEKHIQINWQFSIQKARTKMNSAYTRVNGLNQTYQRT